MSILSTKELDGAGRQVSHLSTQAISMEGQVSTLAVDGEANLAVKGLTGQINITVDGDGALFNTFIQGGTITVAKAYGSTAFNGTKDNASTINVYAESGGIVVQNKTAAEVVVTAKSYV